MAELYVAELTAPDRERRRISEGRALAEQGRVDEAEQVFRSLVDSGSVAALTELGLLRDERGDHDGALALFARAMAEGDLAGYLAAGTAALEDGDLDTAERLLRTGIDAGEEAWHWQLAQVLLERGEDDEAEQSLRAALVAGESRAWADLGELLEDRDDLAGAELAYRSGAAEGDEGDRVALARFLVRVGRPEQARPLLTELVREGHPGAMLALAEVERADGDLDAAADAYLRAVDGGAAEAREGLADLLAYDLDRPAEAIDHWRLALDDADDPAGVWFEIGQAYEALDELDRAEDAYRQMLALGDVSAHHALGELALLREDEDAARRHFEAGLDAGDEDNAEPLRRLRRT